jgi:hypothetical protein
METALFRLPSKTYCKGQEGGRGEEAVIGEPSKGCTRGRTGAGPWTTKQHRTADTHVHVVLAAAGRRGAEGPHGRGADDGGSGTGKPISLGEHRRRQPGRRRQQRDVRKLSALRAAPSLRAHEAPLRVPAAAPALRHRRSGGQAHIFGVNGNLAIRVLLVLVSRCAFLVHEPPLSKTRAAQSRSTLGCPGKKSHSRPTRTDAGVPLSNYRGLCS